MLEIAEILTLCSVAPGFQHTGGQLRKSPQKTSINSNFASALSVNCSQMLEAIVLTRYWNALETIVDICLPASPVVSKFG